MLFLEELEELKDRFMQRLSLFHVISGEEQDIPICTEGSTAQRFACCCARWSLRRASIMSSSASHR